MKGKVELSATLPCTVTCHFAYNFSINAFPQEQEENPSLSITLLKGEVVCQELTFISW